MFVWELGRVEHDAGSFFRIFWAGLCQRKSGLVRNNCHNRTNRTYLQLIEVAFDEFDFMEYSAKKEHNTYIKQDSGSAKQV